MAIEKKDAYRRIRGLRETLERIVEHDGEQEVQGMAVPVVDAAMAAARRFLGADDPLVAVSTDVVTVEMIEAGEPLRAVDALVVARQLEAALYEPPRMSVW